MDAIPADTEAKLKSFCSPYVMESLHYLRALFLARIGETENVESSEKAEQRKLLLTTSEEVMRASLKRIQLAEELAYIKGELAAAKAMTLDRDEARITALGEQLAACYERAAIPADLQETLYESTEEEMCLADQRSQRLSLILRERATLARVFRGQGLLLESFYILRQGLVNFKALAEGQYREVERGTESESKGSFKLPDALSASSAPAAGAKKGAPPPKDAKGKAATPVEDATVKAEEEARAKAAEKDHDRLRAVVEAQERRSHPAMGLWLSTKIAIIRALHAEKRFEDVADAIAVTRLEASSVKDKLFTR